MRIPKAGMSGTPGVWKPRTDGRVCGKDEMATRCTTITNTWKKIPIFYFGTTFFKNLNVKA